jgi:hypothetical protein
MTICAKRWSTSSNITHFIMIKYDVISLSFKIFSHYITIHILIIAATTAAIIQESVEFFLIEIISTRWNLWNRTYIGVIVPNHNMILLILRLCDILSWYLYTL